MSVHLPSLKQLQYLVALRRYGHFGKAELPWEQARVATAVPAR